MDMEVEDLGSDRIDRDGLMNVGTDPVCVCVRVCAHVRECVRGCILIKLGHYKHL